MKESISIATSPNFILSLQGTTITVPSWGSCVLFVDVFLGLSWVAQLSELQKGCIDSAARVVRSALTGTQRSEFTVEMEYKLDFKKR